jgi:hypothetical protein
MFCPECGKEESQSVPFCRACGTDLRPIRVAVETPDSITLAAANAREEIGRAVAAKIRETQDTYELKKVAEDVLPQIEKFLESPEEKRLRRMRVGMMLLVIGLGVAIALTLIAVASGDPEILLFAGLGFVGFLVGLAFILNGVFLTSPKNKHLSGVADRIKAPTLNASATNTNDLQMPEPVNLFSSVTEHTTRHLKDDELVHRD